VLLVASFYGLRAILGPAFFPHNGMNAVFPLLISAIGMRFLNAYWRKKLMREMDAAPIRQGTRSVVLSADGISSPSSLIVGVMRWSDITDVAEQSDLTLLLFSPIEYIPLPDAGLPEGLTRAALLTQIASWRDAAKP